VPHCPAGQYKYGWHALPRDYQAGVSRQPAPRASLDHGIRRRSIDVYRVRRQPSGVRWRRPVMSTELEEQQLHAAYTCTSSMLQDGCLP
jgi:hypothetical protein